MEVVEYSWHDRVCDVEFCLHEPARLIDSLMPWEPLTTGTVRRLQGKKWKILQKHKVTTVTVYSLQFGVWLHCDTWNMKTPRNWSETRKSRIDSQVFKHSLMKK